MAERYRRDYFEHINKYGYESCCHIPRHHGDEISLLTEIVNNNKWKILFTNKHLKAKQIEEQKFNVHHPVQRIHSEKQMHSNRGKH